MPLTSNRLHLYGLSGSRGIRLTAFADANGDTVFDPGEVLLGGVKFALQRAGQTLMTETTNTEGMAVFRGVTPGSYVLALAESLPGYAPVYAQLAVSAQAGQVAEADWPFEIATPTVTPSATHTFTPTITATATLTATPTPHRIWLPLLLK